MADRSLAADRHADPVLEAELAAEQRHVDHAYARLAAAVAEATALAREAQRHGQVEHEGGVQEEHVRALFERDVLAHHAARRLAELDAEHDGLVFGRLDDAEGGVRYVGRLGLRDEQYEPLVIDWRAPAAAVFYQATAAEPHGVVRRRILRSSGQRVVGISDDLLDADRAPAGMPVVGDGALLAAMTRARGGTMRDIVATIQAEQDRAIRAPAAGTTLISGGPGTGKTVVALHRAAYLLYSDRRRFTAGGVLVVGPSPAFLRYIEQVLPSLGEHTVTLRALGEFVDGVTATRYDSPECARVKGSLRVRRVLRRAVQDAPPGAPDELRLYHAGRVLRLDAGQLAEIRRATLRHGVRPNQARADAVRGLLTALWQQATAGARVRGDRQDFDADVGDRDAFVSFVHAWWPVLAPVTVLGWLADRRRLARYARGVLSAGEVDLLAASWVGPEPAAPADDGQLDLEWPGSPATGPAPDGVSVADVALLDELAALLGEPPPPPSRRPAEIHGYAELTTVAEREFAAPQRPDRLDREDEYAHVLVDEAQDLSPMQWRMLGRRGQHASWTVVGDLAQSSWPDPAEAVTARDAALRPPLRTFRLSVNYRNSAEIFADAAQVIRRAVPDADLPDAVRATGRHPDHRVVSSAEVAAAVRAAVTELLALVDGTVGVIGPVRRRDEVAGWVAGLPDRVRVTTGLECKGLEYDGVVAVEPGAIAAESPVGVRTLYVVLSRATQHLVTVATDGEWLASFGLRASPQVPGDRS